MMYRVVLLVNGKYKKTFSRCKYRENAFKSFYRILNKNKVVFPKKFINYDKIKKVKYELCVTKPTEDGDQFRLIRDKTGRLHQEKPLGDWTILHSDEYEVEETFWMYGRDPKEYRPTIMDIVKILSVGAYAKNNIRQAIVVHNKLVIYNEDQFDMILCKNIHDAQRLHHKLFEILKKNKIKTIIFMGTASKFMISEMYELIMQRTNWPILKVSRRTTRP